VTTAASRAGTAAEPTSAAALGGPLPEHTGVLVVGTGFAGIAAAVSLLRDGRTDFLLLEKATSVGGTWRDNTYPGCACDVPSRLYSLSFAPNPEWTRAFSAQPEIRAYLERTARDFGVLPYCRFGAELLDARWDDDEQHWVATTSRGTVTADVLIAATGGLSTPVPPRIPGLETFEGTVFHSAEWDHEHDLTGERIGVIGTGASAIQFVPQIRKVAQHVTVFQRTAPWVLPRRDRAITGAERALYRRFPKLMDLPRFGLYAVHESWLLGYSYNSRMIGIAEKEAMRHIASAISDPVLREKVTPTFRLGCKRTLLSNDYYPALAKDNVSLETDRIVEIRPHGIVTQAADGTLTEHEVDTLVLGTGFAVTDQPMAHQVFGRDGRSMADHWSETGMQALHGTTVAGFPNYFHLAGPHTGQGHTSAVFMIEQQVGYTMRALQHLRQAGIAAVEPRPEAVERFVTRVQRRMKRTVWSKGGCSSWYIDPQGRITTLWPTFTFLFKKQLSQFPAADYVAHPRRKAKVGAAA
jgi:cation diffusion facilitator CzcD-associated flavoprotein CzcO